MAVSEAGVFNFVCVCYIIIMYLIFLYNYIFLSDFFLFVC